MQSVIVSISPDLADQGSFLSLSATLDEAGYQVGQLSYQLKDGITYHAQLSNTGSAIVLRGSVRATAVGECARCLDSVEFEVDGGLEGFYLFSEDAPEAEGLEDDEYEIIGQQDAIDISDAILAALTIATPQVLLCKEECQGLCPSCGANLNDGPCGCEADADAIDETNPFYKLKGIVFDDPQNS